MQSRHSHHHRGHRAVVAGMILVIGALLLVHLEYSAERFTTVWPASPRAVAAWLMWAAAIRELSHDGRVRNWEQL